MPRLAAKKDANHDDICWAFRRLGWYVYECYRHGMGLPDTIISKPWINVYVEIKSEGGELTDDEQQFWEGCPGPKEIVRTLDDVLAVDRKYGLEWMP